MRTALLMLLYPEDHGIPPEYSADEAAAFVDDPQNARVFPANIQCRADRIGYLHEMRGAQIRGAAKALERREQEAGEEAHRQHLAECAAEHKVPDRNFTMLWHAQRKYKAEQLDEGRRQSFEEMERQRLAALARGREEEAEREARAAVEELVERRARVAAAEKTARAALRAGPEEPPPQNPLFWRQLRAALS